MDGSFPSTADLGVCQQVLALLAEDPERLWSKKFNVVRDLLINLCHLVISDGSTPIEHVQASCDEPKEHRHSSELGSALTNSDVVELKRGQFSRMLYTNPVCLLTSCASDFTRNIMTISWLTPIDNRGRFICSINKRRHSATGVLAHRHFVLNVPTADLAGTVLKVGGCTGANVDKIESFPQLRCCEPGWKPLEDWPPLSPTTGKPDPPAFALAPCVAHIVAQVVNDLSHHSCQNEHHILECEILKGYVKSSHWDKKGQLKPGACGAGTAPPYLTFFGSQTFGYVLPHLPGSPQQT